MAMEVDFKLYKNKLQSKGFRFRNSDETYYDFSDSTVRLDWYKDGPDSSPISLLGTITSATAYVQFIIPAENIDTIGTSEYFVIVTKSGTTETILTKGNIIVEDYVPFSSSIEAFLSSELPEGVILSQNFVSQKIKYWRLFLQCAFSVTDANLDKDSAWPPLVNALIAKLIIYDLLDATLKGNLISIFGGQVSPSYNSNNVKSIETAPTKVEFYAAGELMSNIARSGTGSKGNILNQFQVTLCGLADKVGVKLPMCVREKFIISPTISRNPNWDYVTLDDIISAADIN